MIDVLQECVDLIERLSDQKVKAAMPDLQAGLREIAKKHNMSGSQVFGFYMDWYSKQNKMEQDRLLRLDALKFTCMRIDIANGTREPFASFEVNALDIAYVQEETLVQGGEERIPVIYLKDGKRCVSIATWDDPSDGQAKRDLLLSLMR